VNHLCGCFTAPAFFAVWTKIANIRAERYGCARRNGIVKFAWLFRLLGEGGKSARYPVVYDPVYGLAKSEIDAWLAHNPELRREHEAEL
jgi:hypothetical protein